MEHYSGESQLLFARRLVAFGDIVFGFSLSQLALQLTRPTVPSDLLKHSPELFGFFGTFVIISSFWLVSHRAHENVRRADGPIIVATFLALMAVAISPYVLDMYFRFGPDRITTSAYALSFGIFFTANAIIVASATRQRAGELTPYELRRSRIRIWRWAIAGGVFLGSLALMPVSAKLGAASWMLIIVGMLAVRRRFRAQVEVAAN